MQLASWKDEGGQWSMTLKCVSGLSPTENHKGIKTKRRIKEKEQTLWRSDKEHTLEIITEMPRSRPPYTAEKSSPQPQGMNENRAEQSEGTGGGGGVL